MNLTQILNCFRTFIRWFHGKMDIGSRKKKTEPKKGSKNFLLHQLSVYIFVSGDESFVLSRVKTDIELHTETRYTRGRDK